jgi:hypothetical protein
MWAIDHTPALNQLNTITATAAAAAAAAAAGSHH